MTVRIVLKSKEGLCVVFDNVDHIVATDNMVVLQCTSRWGKEHTQVIKKKDIRYFKIIQKSEESGENE